MRPPPDGEETRKPGVGHGALVGPGAIFQALFRDQFLIAAVDFSRGANVLQNSLGAGTVGIAPREFGMVQHAIGELDVERRPGGTPLVGGSRDPVNHLVPRIIRGHQEVECAGVRKRGSAMIRSAVAANSARSAGSLISQKPRCTPTKSSATEDAGDSVGPS